MLLTQHRAAIIQHRPGNALHAAGRAFQHRIILARQSGESLGLRAALQCGSFALHDLRQALVVVIGDVVAAFLVDFEKAVEQHHLPGGAQADLAIAAGDIDGGALHPGGFHLAGDRAFPDQIIQAALVGIGQAQLFRAGRHIGGADTFMRFLRVLGLVLIHARRFRHIVRAKAAGDFIAGRHHGFGRHVDAVRPQIGDQAGLEHALGGGHALLRAHAEFSAGFLLQS